MNTVPDSGDRVYGPIVLDLMAGDSVVRRAVRNGIEAGLSPVIVVLGFEAERVADELAHLDIQPVLNPDVHLGISTSVQLGISCVPDRCSGAMVILAEATR